jgi:3-mercaptopyruvate sulfurtransferase SseA
MTLRILVALFSFLLVAAACQQKAAFKKYPTDLDVPRITAADAKKDVDAGTAVIVDSRPEAVFNGEHIAGAINIPFGMQDTMMDKVPKGKKIIIYCS